jgi:hypothetical protein
MGAAVPDGSGSHGGERVIGLLGGLSGTEQPPVEPFDRPEPKLAHQVVARCEPVVDRAGRRTDRRADLRHGNAAPVGRDALEGGVEDLLLGEVLSPAHGNQRSPGKHTAAAGRRGQPRAHCVLVEVPASCKWAKLSRDVAARKLVRRQGGGI